MGFWGPRWRCGMLVAVCVLLAHVSLTQSQSWTGNTCSRQNCVYRTKRVCAYRTWLGCCAYKTVKEPVWETQYFCCNGWKDSNGNKNCVIPICSPPCENGGTCTSPDKCSCRSSFTGPRCANSQCSHMYPCYPGICSHPNACSCTAGFLTSGLGAKDRCLILEDTQKNKPVIYQMQVRLSYWPRTGPTMEKYAILADSTERDDMDFFWSDRKNFNRLEIVASGEFSVASLPSRPDYISNSSFGLVSAKIHILLTKLGRPGSGGDRVTSLNETKNCSSSLSPTSPETKILNCSIDDKNFDRIIESGDILKVTFNAESGGFRTLYNLDTKRNADTQTFVGRSNSMAVEFRYDFDRPAHCSEASRSPCQRDNMLKVPDLLRQKSLLVEWGGWEDSLSGMQRYAVEVFLLTKVTDGELEVREPLKPVLGPVEVNHTGSTQNMTFAELKEPGMYAVILEVSDRANNSRYVRRLVLFDPTSSVTVDPEHQFVFSSASPMANYTYQNDTKSSIVADWTGFFRNALHEEGAWLGSVRPYPQQLEDNRKTIDSALDDNDGERTVNATPNARGIVKFEVAYFKDSGGARQSRPQDTDWKNNRLEQTFAFPDQVDNGDTVTLWVRATDVMGRQLERSTHVTFDTTPPQSEPAVFEMNKQVEGFHFSSLFRLMTMDRESGIAMVRWTFIRSNGTVLYQEEVKPKTTRDCPQEQLACYCTDRERQRCFLVEQDFPISNCRMMVEKEKLATERITVQWEVFNSAGLVHKDTMLKGELTALNGTEGYFPPQNVRSVKISATAVSLTWELPVSCFKRTEIWIAYTDTDNESHQTDKRKVHANETRFDLAGMRPGTQYTVNLIINYDGQKSEPQSFTFTTAADPASAAALGGGAIAGITIGLLVVLVVIILALVVWRSQTARRKINDFRSSRRRGRLVDTSVKASNIGGIDNRMTVNHDEDLYLAADQAWNTHPSWQVDAKDLTLLDQIISGKFADIYKATWKKPGSTDVTVVAKLLKANFSQNDVNRMIAKIQFFATQVGNHDNVLHFYGAVLDNTHLGPTMLLEYCESGQLDKWLKNLGGVASEDTIDKLFRFSLEIASGMHYLTTRKIVHERLAARNVLLTFLLDVRIAGFGPQDDKAEDSQVPVKWAAPEILENKPATKESDVWSYGVTLWEIFSLGKVPYPDVRANEIGPYLKAGKRMDKPELADDTFYKLMQDCWQENPKNRPRFAHISKQLTGLFKPAIRSSQDIYYDKSELN